MAHIIDCKIIANATKFYASMTSQYLYQLGVVPKLAVIQVGEDPASGIYIRNKLKACEECGVECDHVKLLDSVTGDKLIDEINRLNGDATVHGIMLQMPLPEHLMDGVYYSQLIDYNKDVESASAVRLGADLLGYGAETNVMRPCTVQAVIDILEDIGVDFAGKHAVIVGRSNIVGKPLIGALLNEDCTVTCCHSKTADLANHTRMADILVVAAGKPGLITGDMVKEGAIVIDVGINRLEDGKVVGDVAFDEVEPKASFITKVPGGVGLVTVAELVNNVVELATMKFFESRKGGETL